MRLRPATEADAELLLDWRNDPSTRRNAIQQERIGREEHQSWLERKLREPSCLLLIGEVDGTPVGQVRFDLEGVEAEVSITIAPNQRGRGLGTALLRQACQAVEVRRLVALVRPENPASLEVFSKNGFVRQGSTRRSGVALIVLAMQRLVGEGPVVEVQG